MQELRAELSLAGDKKDKANVRRKQAVKKIIANMYAVMQDLSPCAERHTDTGH